VELAPLGWRGPSFLQRGADAKPPAMTFMIPAGSLPASSIPHDLVERFHETDHITGWSFRARRRAALGNDAAYDSNFENALLDRGRRADSGQVEAPDLSGRGRAVTATPIISCSGLQQSRLPEQAGDDAG
jgi:hypothetical protein